MKAYNVKTLKNDGFLQREILHIFYGHAILIMNINVYVELPQQPLMMTIMMMMMNCFYDTVDQRKTFSLISSRDHCQRSSPLQISDTP